MEPRVSAKGPALLQLPVELILQIWEYMSVADVLAFRQVCRHIETMLFDPFCKEFFTERRFSITFKSLKALIEITKCTRLQNRLASLTIGLDRLHTAHALPRFSGDWDSFNHTIPDESFKVARVDPYKLEALAREQDFLISSGKFQAMLCEALSNLPPRLEEFVLRDHNVLRKNQRAGMKSVLASYGWSYILGETGVDFTGTESHLDAYDDRFVDMVFSATLLALAQSNIQIDVLRGDIVHDKVGFSSTAFTVPRFIDPDIHHVLSNLRSLDLAVSFVQVPLGSYSDRSNSFFKWQTHQVFSLLEKTPNLVSLRIQSKEQGFFVDGIINWLATLLDPAQPLRNQAPSLSPIPHGPKFLMIPQFNHRFECLKELQLGCMKAPARIVTKILQCLATSLRRLNLSKIALWVTSDDDELDNNPSRPNAWSSVFSYMHGSLNLEQLSLSSLEHHTPSCHRRNGHPVAFIPSNFGIQSGPTNGLLYVWSHQGSANSIKDFLEELNAKTIILCRDCKKRKIGYRSVEEILITEV
ncbi:hypothetical protein F5Y08DRAFT_353688 [Xylaria arbuscula]|nr:hypothetical protein F5Y08DRAFT_353688 [Xylaria arbuscula]